MDINQALAELIPLRSSNNDLEEINEVSHDLGHPENNKMNNSRNDTESNMMIKSPYRLKGSSEYLLHDHSTPRLNSSGIKDMEERVTSDRDAISQTLWRFRLTDSDFFQKF